MLDLNQVAVFVSVVEAGSFTQAAKKLEMPKSTVSRWVSELEERLGVTLLQRTTRKLTLTDVGAAYYERCRHAVAEAKLAEQAVHDSEQVPRGTLRVTAPPGMNFLVDIVARFMCRYPEVESELILTQRRVDLIGEGFDVGIRPGALDDHTSLKVRRLGNTRSWIVASPEYLERHGAPSSIDEIAKHPCIRFMTSRGVMPWEFDVDGERVDVEVHGRFTTNDFRAVQFACFSGLGLALIPEPSAQESVESGQLVRVLPELQAVPFPLNVIFPAARYLSPRIRAFVDFLAEEISPLRALPPTPERLPHRGPP